MKINIGKNINLHVGTVFDYIKEYGRLSFAEKPFCEIDSLILSQFSYLKLDGIVPMIDELGKSVNLLQMKEHPRVDHLFADERWRKETHPARYRLQVCSEGTDGPAENRIYDARGRMAAHRPPLPSGRQH